MSKSQKQYKNVYTILEKAKKGELNSYYNNRDGLFGKINFYKKPDLIKPHLHYLDDSRLNTIVRNYITDNETLKKYFAEAKSGKNSDFDKYKTDFTKNFEKLPKHLINDIFKMYYHKMENLDFEERTTQNYTKFKILEKSNNPIGKIMAENSSLKSAIFTRNMISYLVSRLTHLQFTDKEEHQNMLNGLNGDSEFDQQSDEALKKMFDSQSAKQQLEKEMNDAQQLCKNLDGTLDNEVQEQIFETANKDGGLKAGDLSPDYIRKVNQRLETINLSMGSLKEKIKKLLDKSVNYFSSSKITIHEDLLNSDNISGLDDYELLHPKIRKMFLEDIMVKETKNVGKIDIYIDISGSMSSSCGVKNANGDQVSNLDFCKSFVFKLEQLGMLNDVYIFNTKVRKYKKDPISIAMLDTSGGTSIDVVVHNIAKNGLNALVITDAEDSCSIYSDKAFFIGVEGSSFYQFEQQCLNQYTLKNQMIVFNGTTIKNVGRDGNPI